MTVKLTSNAVVTLLVRLNDYTRPIAVINHTVTVIT